MQIESYFRIKELYKSVKTQQFQGEITDEQLKSILDASSRGEVYTKEEIEFVKNWINEGGTDEFIIQKMKSDFEEATLEERISIVKSYLQYPLSYVDLCRAFSDTNILLDQIESLPYLNKACLVHAITLDDLSAYINNNGQNSDEILNILSIDFEMNKNGDEPDENARFIESLESDIDRAKILIYGGSAEFLPYVKNRFYRNLVFKSKSPYCLDKQSLIDEIDEYNSYYAQALKIEDEQKRAEFISSIGNNEMKEAMLFDIIERRANRDIIINSFTRNVDSEIEKIDVLAQTMINEFFEDELGVDFTEEKREVLNIIFNTTNVLYDWLEYLRNGEVNSNLNLEQITISSRYKGRINRVIGFLIHEYAHRFSVFDYKYTMEAPLSDVEEGMADAFTELVINHYINKHKDVMIDGKKVRIDSPYEAYSSYCSESAVPRTMLAGLTSSGKDIKALGEYYLGSKNKFAEMVFGVDGAKSKKHTKFGMALIEADIEELYSSPMLDFSNIDRNSIYYRRNYILPLFEIQRKIHRNCVSIPSNNTWGPDYHDAQQIAQEYLGERKFYEIPKEELSEFWKLLNGQIPPNKEHGRIGGIKEYRNNIIASFTDEEIRQHSFEIIERVPIIVVKDIELEPELENVMRIAFDEEIRKIQEGQSNEETKRKLDVINQGLKGVFVKNIESDNFINECINDFCFEALEALRENQDRRDKGASVQITVADIGAAVGFEEKEEGDGPFLACDKD